jgi:hypothetical protein
MSEIEFKYIDKTRNERQRRRRIKEKRWLKKHGFKSWEALHTRLMDNKLVIAKPPPEVKESLN